MNINFIMNIYNIKIFVISRSHLESKLKVFNQYYEGKSGGIRSREVKKNIYFIFIKI